MRLRALARTAAALVAAGTVLTACSGGSGAASDAGPAASSATPSATAMATDSAEAEPASDSSPSAADLGTPVAERDGSANGNAMRLGLYPVVRDGDTAVLNFTVTADQANEGSLSLYGLFSDDNGDAGDRSSDSSVDGVKLIDGKNGKAYLVASDGAGHCLCTIGLLGNGVDPGERRVLSATFAAPPEGVDSVSVFVPPFGTVPGVPVQ